MSGDFISWYNLLDARYKVGLGECVAENVDFILKNTHKLPDYNTGVHLKRFLQLMRHLVFEGAIQCGVKDGISKIMMYSLSKHFNAPYNEMVYQTEPVDLFFLLGQPKQALDNPVDREKVVYDVLQTQSSREFQGNSEWMACLTIGFVVMVNDFLTYIHPETLTEFVLSGIASPFAIHNDIHLERSIKTEVEDDGYSAAIAAPARQIPHPVEMVVARENQRDQRAHHQMPRTEQQHQSQPGAGAPLYRHQQRNRRLTGVELRYASPLLYQAIRSPPPPLHLHQHPIPMNSLAFLKFIEKPKQQH